MENLKIGDILHCSGQKYLSRAIKFFTKSEFSHSAIFIEIWGQPYIIDAQKDGVNVRPFDEWIKMFNYKFTVTRFPDAPENEHDFCIRAMSKSGNTAYDFEGLLLKHPAQLITGKYKEGKNDQERMYCSEYVAWAHQIPNNYKLTPKDLYNVCIAREAKIVFLH